MNLLLVWIAACGVPAMLPGEVAEQVAADATFEVAENSPEGTQVGMISHSPEATRFELLEEDDSVPFAVDAATGRITVRRPDALDFETRRRFTFTVRVTMKAAKQDADPLWKSFAERLGPEEGDDLLAPRETVVERRIRVRLVDVEEPTADPKQTPAGTDPGATTATTQRPPVKIIGPPVEAPRPSFPPRHIGSAPAIAGNGPADAGPGHPVPHVPRDPPVAGPSDPPVAGPSDPAVAGPSDPAVAGPANTEQPGGPVLLQPGDVPPVPSHEPDPVATTADPVQPVPSPPSPSAPVRSPAPVPATYWLVAIVLLMLCGIAAHMIRVSALRRRWARSAAGRGSYVDEDVPDAETLVAAAQELVEQQQALAEDSAKLAEDQTRLAEQQQQLESEREELLAREAQVSAAEAQLAAERSELERERQQLESELTRLHDERAARDRRPPREDLYAVDEDERRGPSPRTGDPGASTWVDSSGLDSVEHDAEVEALRAGLAEMLAMSPDQSAADECVDDGRRPPQGSQPTLPEAVQWNPSAGSRDSLYRRTPGVRSDESGTGAAEGDEDSINSYMEALMRRLRQNSAVGPAAPGQLDSSEPAASRPWQRTTEVAVAQPSPAPSAAPADEGDAPPHRQPSARPKADKTVVRERVNSLREVANLSARSAVATYVRRKRSRRGLLVGLSYVALLAMSTALLAGTLGAPLVGTAQSWLVLGMGAVVLVQYFWAVCLSDRRSRPEWKFVMQSRREVREEIDADQPERDEPAMGPRRATTAPRQPRTEPNPATYHTESREPVEETAGAGSSR